MGGHFRIWPIASILGLIERTAIEVNRPLE